MGLAPESKQASKIAGSPNRQTRSAQTPRLVMRGEARAISLPPLSLSLSLCTSRVSIFEMNGGERMGKWDGKFRAFLQNGRGSRRKKEKNTWTCMRSSVWMNAQNLSGAILIAGALMSKNG